MRDLVFIVPLFGLGPWICPCGKAAVLRDGERVRQRMSAPGSATSLRIVAASYVSQKLEVFPRRTCSAGIARDWLRFALLACFFVFNGGSAWLTLVLLTLFLWQRAHRYNVEPKFL